MTPLEIDTALKTLTVLVDTREQDTTRAKMRYAALGRPFKKQTLSYGDYTYNAVVNGQPLFSDTETVNGLCVIERKMSLNELATCFASGRARFEREFQRAKVNNSRVYLLIEGGSWENIINHRYKSRFSPAAYMASLVAWMIRFNMVPVFCKAETSGKIISQILYRDFKERLTRGDFDDENRVSTAE